MNDNKNMLREDAIDFAIEISDLCDEIKGKFTEEEHGKYLKLAGSIRRRLIASITTAKKD